MPGNKIAHELKEATKNAYTNRRRHRHLTERHRQRGHRHPEVRANSDVMGEAAYERHQRSMVHLTGKPENMANYEPGGPKNQHAMEDEDEFGGGRRRRRTRRHRKSRRHTRKH